jgi:hypothetical protein
MGLGAMVSEMARELKYGLMALAIVDNGIRTKLMALVS